jgi:hypothetical protein
MKEWAASLLLLPFIDITCWCPVLFVVKEEYLMVYPRLFFAGPFLGGFLGGLLGSTLALPLFFHPRPYYPYGGFWY